MSRSTTTRWTSRRVTCRVVDHLRYTTPAKNSHADSITSLPESERSRLLASLTKDEAERFLYDWAFWARPSQIAPAGDWRWLIMAGRGFGKTRTGVEWVRRRRVAVATEIDPLYCDIAAMRWEKLTGQKAVRHHGWA